MTDFLISQTTDRQVVSVAQQGPPGPRGAAGQNGEDGAPGAPGVTSMAPVASVPMHTAETVISNFQAGHGFVKQGAGVQADDTTVFLRQSQSMKQTASGANEIVFTRKTNISPVVNLTGRTLKVYLRLDHPADITELWIAVSSDNFATSFVTWKISDDLSQVNQSPDTWIPITLAYGRGVVTGSPNRAAINAIQIRLKDKNTGIPVSLWMGAISHVAEQSAGVVTIAFDDSWASQVTEARKKMSQYGMPGVIYAMPDYLGNAGYCTEEMLRETQDLHGWDIASHYQTNLTTLGGAAEVETALRRTKTWLMDHGFRAADHLAYPNGAFDEAVVLPIVRRMFATARTIATYPETLPAPDWHRLRCLLITNTMTPATIATKIAEAVSAKEWVILVFHKIVAAPTVSTEYSIADFATVIDNIAASGVAVKTITGAIRGI